MNDIGGPGSYRFGMISGPGACPAPHVEALSMLPNGRQIVLDLIFDAPLHQPHW